MSGKKWLLIAVIALLLLAAVLGVSRLVSYIEDERAKETEPPETYVTSEGHALTYEGNLSPEQYPVGTPVGDWLAGCDGEDRNDQISAYILRHAVTEGEMTTYTFLIYYRHGGSALAADPSILEGESGNYRIDLTYTPGEGTEGYALSRLAVTLPTAETPRLRLLHDGASVGSLVTKTSDVIPSAES